MVAVQREEKPELVFADLVQGREFRPLVYAVTEELVRDFTGAVGDNHPLYRSSADRSSPGLAPPGLAAIYARLSYLQDHLMPTGGVLAKQEFIFKKPVRIGETLEIQARVADRGLDDKQRKRVTFHIEARNRQGDAVSEVWLYAIWPK